ncbi:Cytochrome P450 [Arachis hypogaea]|nr:Cytochrome P450 [Arachis hypogaea]
MRKKVRKKECAIKETEVAMAAKFGMDGNLVKFLLRMLRDDHDHDDNNNDDVGIRKKVNKLRKPINEALEHIIEDHQNTNYDDDDDSPQKKDFVDILLSFLDQPMDPDEEQHKHVLTRNDIKAIMMDMIGAAYETSTSAIEWVMSELLKHPSVMKKLQHEIQHAVGGINKEVEENEIENMPYLDMVVKETLRLYPVAPLLVPHVSRNDVVIEGYYIKRNTQIIINAWAIGRDPRVWSENAEKFYPERFEHNNVDILGRDFRFIPFGSGRRGCPGAQLGFATIKFVVAQLVHCFNWELPFGMSCDELDMNETFGITIPRTTHLLAIPTFRLTAEAASNKE